MAFLSEHGIAISSHHFSSGYNLSWHQRAFLSLFLRQEDVSSQSCWPCYVSSRLVVANWSYISAAILSKWHDTRVPMVKGDFLSQFVCIFILIPFTSILLWCDVVIGIPLRQTQHTTDILSFSFIISTMPSYVWMLILTPWVLMYAGARVPLETSSLQSKWRKCIMGRYW